MFERYLVQHCSPALAALKTANMFCFPFSSEEELKRQLRIWNERLERKGVSLLLLRVRKKSAMIYVFRRFLLQRDLSDPQTAYFLSCRGYPDTGADDALGHLKRRLLEKENFPHEIGLFLGYPLRDVIGFIRNEGKNCKCADCWKVYGDEREAKKIFEAFRKCREVYLRLWKEGRSVSNLTVAA